MPLVSHLESGTGFRGFLWAGGTTRESSGSRIIALYDVKGMSLVVLEYSYEGVLAEGGGSEKALVGCIGNRANEVIYGFVDLFGREVGRRGVGESVQLVVLERCLLLVASPSEELAGAGNGGNVGRVRYYNKLPSGVPIL